MAERLGALLAENEAPPNLDRVVFAVAEPGRGRGMSAVDIFTFRRAASGMAEDELLRGVHPEMADRLQLKRLANFTLERLPSPAEDVYLVLGKARSNPKEERLFALAEVRDLTPVRDSSGQVASLPEFERMLVQALDGIRHFQAHRKPSRRPQWNRVLLYAWPVIELTPAEIGAAGEPTRPLDSRAGDRDAAGPRPAARAGRLGPRQGDPLLPVRLRRRDRGRRPAGPSADAARRGR